MKKQSASTALPLILASASPRRATLLGELGVPFEVIPVEVSERTTDCFTPSEVARLNAHLKARVVARKHPDRIVLGADTVVCLGHRLFGKPASLSEARSFLKALQGHSHEVVTGVCLMRCQPRRERLFAVTTTVRFRALTGKQISHYLSLVNPLDKAGAYAIQEHGELIVEEISGSYTNVVGLPVERLEEELAWIRAPLGGSEKPVPGLPR